jgi:lipopolysaccharide assembly protein A
MLTANNKMNQNCFSCIPHFSLPASPSSFIAPSAPSSTFPRIDFSDALRHNLASAGGNMRILYLVLIVLLVGVTALFALQNLQTITVSFFNWSVTLPIAFIIIGVYILGMASGGSVLAFLRWTLRRARKTR